MMVRILRCLLALSAVLLAQVPLARADAEVDLLLVLAVDVSRSIDQTKFLLQRDGYAAAISNRGVLEAIKSGPHQKIGLNFVEWSGFGAQKLVIDWTVIDGPDAAPRSAAASSSQPLRSSAPRSRRRDTSSTYPATAPTMPAATSERRATRPPPRGSSSTDW
jgi:hypothetical protein